MKSPNLSLHPKGYSPILLLFFFELIWLPLSSLLLLSGCAFSDTVLFMQGCWELPKIT